MPVTKPRKFESINLQSDKLDELRQMADMKAKELGLDSLSAAKMIYILMASYREGGKE